ncbi:hypothetical protein [Amycolatopsis sp. NBC_01480]|uniref:hypothetical protein n=1 Tax=Amycolatopsis sp. NBC_01480 TaxID=2903562 RepID=UPI002E2D47D4|nr:hypothetical protein [Amycolatopsis sp. NBC_01480]
MTSADSKNIGIAYINDRGREVQSIGGCASLEAATSEAQRSLDDGLVNAVRAVIYLGRSLNEGEVLAELEPRKRRT